MSYEDNKYYQPWNSTSQWPSKPEENEAPWKQESQGWTSHDYRSKWWKDEDEEKQEISQPADSSESDRGKKRAREYSPDPNDRTKKGQCLEIMEDNEGLDGLYKEGNLISRSDIKTVVQEDIAAIGEDPVTQAMWVIVEQATYGSYHSPWLRPATLLSDHLEEQFQQGIGCQTCKLTFTRADGSTKSSFFEHDLRREPWVQKRFNNEDKKYLVSCKQLHRVMIQGSKQ
jgi:hypothetical protein